MVIAVLETLLGEEILTWLSKSFHPTQKYFPFSRKEFYLFTREDFCKIDSKKIRGK